MLNRLFALDPQKVASRLDAAVARSVDGKAVRNAVLHVDSPRSGIRETWAHGVADERDGRPMRPDTPFVSASVGKLAMAATAFNLAAQGIIDLDAPISNWVAEDTLRGLPVVGGGHAIARITTRLLLANRSGVPDYFDSDVHPSADGAPSLARLMISEPGRNWSREELIAYARDHYAPFAAPGEKFLYSDLNWDLLGVVFEGATQKPFYTVVRDNVLTPLRMTQTWYHVFEEAPSGSADIADTFFGRSNLVRSRSMTLDQAGGGLVGPPEDLGRLIRGLANGVPVSLELLASNWTEDAMNRGLDYGYGAWRWRPGRMFFAPWQLPELIGVSGSNNSYAYVTGKGDVIAGTMNQMDDPSRHVKFVLAKVVPLLARTVDTQPTTAA